MLLPLRHQAIIQAPVALKYAYTRVSLNVSRIIPGWVTFSKRISEDTFNWSTFYILNALLMLMQQHQITKGNSKAMMSTNPKQFTTQFHQCH